VSLGEREGDLRIRAVDSGDDRLGDERGRLLDEALELLQRPALDMDAGRRQNDAVRVRCGRVGHSSIEGPALVVETAERLLVLTQRTVAPFHPLPRGIDVDVDQDRERAPGRRLAHQRRLDRPPAECEHRRLRLGEKLTRSNLLDRPERLLTLCEQRGDVDAELVVDIDGAAPQPLRHRRGKGRLAGAHEADEDEMAV